MRKFDSILNVVGEFGTYQKKLYFLLCLWCTTVGVFVAVPILVVAEPIHRCAIPSYDNDTFTVQNDYHQELIKSTIPVTIINGKQIYDMCTIFESLDSNDSLPASNSSRVGCNQWVYDKTYFNSSAVTEMNLVCSKRSFRSHIMMSFVAGTIVGHVLSGTFADLFGRKRILTLSAVVSVVTGFSTAWLNHPVPLCIAVLGSGALCTSIYSCVFVIGMEFTGPRKRFLAGTVLDFFFAFGECLVALVGYIFRDRNVAISLLTLPNVLFSAVLWWIPESPRWLILKDRPRKVTKIVNRLAKVNGTTAPKELTDNLQGDTQENVRIIVLLKSWSQAWRFGVLCFSWFAVSLLFYGLTLLSMDTVGNPYLNLFLFSLIEIPAYAMDMFLLKLIARKQVVCVAMCIGGIACICTVFPVIYGVGENQYAGLALRLIGKFGAAMAFTTLVTFTTELLPTVIRNSGLAVCSLFARAGALVAPYIGLLGSYVDGRIGPAVPVIFIGAVAIMAGFSNIVLPHTKGRPLPETVADMQSFTRT